MSDGSTFVDFEAAAVQARDLTATEALRGLATVVLLSARVLRVLNYSEERIAELLHETLALNLPIAFGRPAASDPAADPSPPPAPVEVN